MNLTGKLRTGTQAFGARLMLEVLAMKYGWEPRLIEDGWNRYLWRVRRERQTAIEGEMKKFRFSLVYRQGRDADWIRSWNKHGLPPIPDD